MKNIRTLCVFFHHTAALFCCVYLHVTDDLNKIMYEKKCINVMKRKLAEHDNLKITIEQTGDKFHIKESSTFRTKDIDFTLGVQFDYSLADGTEVSGTWEMDGDTLRGKFTRKDNNKVLTTTRTLEGGELVQVKQGTKHNEKNND
uniref:Lipocalin/cytosolic fatty-acid binding domain-containing protein n=1 Tax=Sphaeramia orbicularis TaxID=375764 RepID=A0A673CVU4_9TELE